LDTGVVRKWREWAMSGIGAVEGYAIMWENWGGHRHENYNWLG